MYAAGVHSPFKEPSLRFLEGLARSRAADDYCTNTEVLQEILHRYKSLNKISIGFQIFDIVLNMGIVIHPVELSDMVIARRLLQTISGISTRDAVHLGMVERRHIKKIVSFDADFDKYPEVQRVILK